MSYPAAHISRDEIRFSMVREDEDYFAHEDEVVKEFHRKAQEAIDGEPLVIFIDATHLSEKSRNATLDALNLENCELYAVNFEKIGDYDNKWIIPTNINAYGIKLDGAIKYDTTECTVFFDGTCIRNSTGIQW